MWSSDLTRRSALAGFLATSACGFRPAFGPNGAADLHGRVALGEADTENEFELAGQLRKRLGPASSPDWTLTFKVTTTSQSFDGIDATRFQLAGEAEYSLEPLKAGLSKITGRVSGFAAYTQADTSAALTALVLSNRAAERDAMKRLMAILADRMLTAITADLARQGP